MKEEFEEGVELEIIKAAGGIVLNDEKEVLMIFRKGRWDFPKGKLYYREDEKKGAMREVIEETGVIGLTLHSALPTTYHTYTEYNSEILKETHWYLMRAPKSNSLKPQIEEQITEVKWVPIQEVKTLLSSSYKTLQELWSESEKTIDALLKE